MGKIIMLMGHNGSETELINSYILTRQEFSKYKIKEIVLHTTRPIRDGELNGINYFFNSAEEMNILEEKIVEKRTFETMNGLIHYFTCVDDINLDNNYITIGNIEAYDSYVKRYDESCIVPIFIKTEGGIVLDNLIKSEMKKENPDYKEMCRTFMKDSNDYDLENLKKRNITNIVDNNSDIENSLEQINKILKLNLK